MLENRVGRGGAGIIAVFDFSPRAIGRSSSVNDLRQEWRLRCRGYAADSVEWRELVCQRPAPRVEVEQ